MDYPAPSGQRAARVTMPAPLHLSSQAERARAAAAALVARDLALVELCGLLDARGELSTWARAGHISAACRQLPAAPPVDGSPWESALQLVCKVGPTHQRRLADLLAELRC